MKPLAHTAAFAALLLVVVGCQSTPVTGTWVAVSASPELEDEVFSAQMMLDEDGYVLARATEKDWEEVDGKRVAVQSDQAYAIEGTWAQLTDQRLEVEFVIADGDEKTIIRCVGILTGADTMDVTLFSPELDGEAYVVQVQRAKAPESAE